MVKNGPKSHRIDYSMTAGKGIADMHRREAECSLDSGYILSLNIRLGW